ncbi:MAG: hypothetical protein ACTHKK_04295 [Candidatus Nitrosocosmicus sp.]
MFLLLLALSHLRRIKQNQQVTCILILQFSFFQMVFWISAIAHEGYL